MMFCLTLVAEFTGAHSVSQRTVFCEPVLMWDLSGEFLVIGL